MSRVHAFSDDALADHDAVALAALLASGQVSPAELRDASAARLQAVEPELNGLAYPAFDAGVGEPPSGFFGGMPTFIKDNCDVAGMPTLHGTDAFVGLPKLSDGELTRMFRATGLQPIGKTRLSEFGFSATAEHERLGPVRNPWDTTRSSGASSAGSAAYVASGVVPIAHANDGGGSIRIPAAACGLVGLKPTRNRTLQDKMMREMPVRIVADGVVTRSVRDTAAFFREAEKVWRNPGLRPIGDVTEPVRGRLKIAVVTSSIGRTATPEVHDQTLKTAGLLEELGHHVEEIAPPVPESFPDDFLLYWSVLAVGVASTGRLRFGRSFDKSRLDNLTRGLERHARRNPHRIAPAMARLALSSRAAAKTFRQYDVILTPTLASATPALGHLDPTLPYETIIDRLMDWVAFTPLQNASGTPALSLPLATSDDGMPLGMMFSAGAGREALLLALGLELEAARPFTRIQDR
jgi:amidase